MLRVNLQPAYILHTRPFRENSFLVEAFTVDYGRVAIVANGIRKSKTHRRGLLQPFIPLLLSWSGRRDLMTLKEIESTGCVLTFSYQNLVKSLYLNELLMRLLVHFDPYPELFQHYQNTLGHLSQSFDQPMTLRIFEKKLLKAIGYELQLTMEADTDKPIQADKWYMFDYSKGPILIDNVAFYDQETLYQGSSLLSLAKEQLDDSSQQKEIKRLIRRALSLYLGAKPLQTRRLLK